MEQYAVYTHSFNDQLFYVGSGRLYTKEERSASRPYDFSNGRSPEWYDFCNNNTDQIEVQMLFTTNDKRESLNKEEEITTMYMNQGMPLVNKNIGARHSEEWKKQHSIAMSGENHPLYGKKHTKESRKKMSLANSGENNYWYGKSPTNAKKVLMINNEINEEKIFDSITKAYNFIVENGFDKTRDTLNNYLNKGPFTFKNYTIEKLAPKSTDQ